MDKKRKVLLIGWDAADWKVIKKLVAKGEMPSIARLMAEGVHGNIATLDPPFSPMLWTSIATGVRPYKHGVLGFIEPDTNKTAIRPVRSTSRKVKAVWNILNQENRKPHVIGWWPSQPVEPINGIMLSNHFQLMKGKISKSDVNPPHLLNFFNHFRIAPSEITAQHLLPFVPKAEKIDQEKDNRLALIAKNIAECSTLHAAATWVLDNQDWDFLAVYLDTIDHFSHGFMKYHPPQMANVSDTDFELYKDVINSAYKFHDMMLGRLMQLAGDDATIILLSDHGFHSDHLRPQVLPDEPAGPAYEHRNYGILCMKGPGIKKGEKIYGASLLDIAPTILSLYDLPIGEDMDGMPLTHAFEKSPEIKTIPSWEQIDGNAGMHPKGLMEDPYETQESIKQLVELGYIEEPDEDNKKNVRNVIKESRYNLARAFMGAKKYDQALPILQELFKNEPHQGRFALRLAESYKHLGDIDASENTLKEFKEKIKETIISEDEMEKIINQPIPKDLSEKKLKKFNTEKQKKLLNNKRIVRDLLNADMLEGEIASIKGAYKKAVAIFQNIEKTAAKHPTIYIQIGNSYLKMGKWDEALKAFTQALEIDAENDIAFHGKAIAYIRKEEYPQAVEAALASLNILYQRPLVHYHLGEALYKYGDYENAEKAFSICLTMAPNMAKARNYLIDIYENFLNKPKNAQVLKEFFKNKSTDNIIETEEVIYQPKKNIRRKRKIQEVDNSKEIIIVSGLPRSGTSLMMQILEKAGMEIFTDNKRTPDESNPKGYYEHEAVKRLARDNKWMKETQGKAVKIIAQLLFALPSRYNYKIIFMNRDIHEILLSQHKMLVKAGKAKADTFSANLLNTFNNTLQKVNEWAKRNYNVEMIYIEHKNLITNPEEEIEKVINFLNLSGSSENLAEVVDKKLHRTKI